MEKFSIVTGGASGLGFEFVKLLLNDKYNVVIVDNDKKESFVGNKTYEHFKRFEFSISLVHYSCESNQLMTFLIYPNPIQQVPGNDENVLLSSYSENHLFGRVYQSSYHQNWRKMTTRYFSQYTD